LEPTFELGFFIMEDRIAPGVYRKELYEYLEKEGLEITEERHNKIRYFVKMASNALSEDLMKKVQGLSSVVGSYKEKYGELGHSKKQTSREKNQTAQQRDEKKVDEKKLEESEEKSDGFFSPKSY